MAVVLRQTVRGWAPPRAPLRVRASFYRRSACVPMLFCIGRPGGVMI
jgi:hypothetical protein